MVPIVRDHKVPGTQHQTSSVPEPKADENGQSRFFPKNSICLILHQVSAYFFPPPNPLLLSNNGNAFSAYVTLEDFKILKPSSPPDLFWFLVLECFDVLFLLVFPSP